MLTKKNVLLMLCIITILLVVLCIVVPLCMIVFSQENASEEFLVSSSSPDGNYVLEAYRTSPGATVDFSVKVYLVKGEQRELIYNAYHEYQVEIIWKNNEIVLINGRELNLCNGDTYDWRKS